MRVTMIILNANMSTQMDAGVSGMRDQNPRFRESATAEIQRVSGAH